MKNKRILFFIPESNVRVNGVYASQVLGLARFCVTQGAKCLIVQYDPEDTRSEYNLESGIDVLNEVQNRPYTQFWFYTRVFKKVVKKFECAVREFSPTHIYTRHYQSCLAISQFAKTIDAKVVYSMRGTDAEEREMSGRFLDRIGAVYIRAAVRKAVKVCSHLNTVSYVFADLLKSRYNKCASVLPCCVPDVSDVGVGAREGRTYKTVVYSGGLWGWQKIDSIIALMRDMAEKDETLRFRFLTKDQKTLLEKCEKIGLPRDRWSGKACAQSEVAEELQKADVGIILRDDTIINRVASPIKIGEYLAAGLALIASPCIGDVGGVLSKEQFAFVYKNDSSVDDVVNFVNGLSAEQHTAAYEFMKKNYTYTGNLKVIEEMFA